MPGDERIVIRISESKKERIKKRVDSLNKTMSAHMIYCYDLEESITKGEAIVIPKSKQIDSDGKFAVSKDFHNPF